MATSRLIAGERPSRSGGWHRQGVLECVVNVSEGRSAAVQPDDAPHVVSLNRLAVSHDEQPLHHVPQLADVAAPLGLLEHVERRG